MGKDSPALPLGSSFFTHLQQPLWKVWVLASARSFSKRISPDTGNAPLGLGDVQSRVPPAPVEGMGWQLLALLSAALQWPAVVGNLSLNRGVFGLSTPSAVSLAGE